MNATLTFITANLPMYWIHSLTFSAARCSNKIYHISWDAFCGVRWSCARDWISRSLPRHPAKRGKSWKGIRMLQSYKRESCGNDSDMILFWWNYDGTL